MKHDPCLLQSASSRWVSAFLNVFYLGVLLLVISLGLFPGAALADEGLSVLVRTSLEPEHPVVGQQVEFRVEVFVDTWFAAAPRFPEIQVDDAIALLPPTASLNFSERIGGRTFAGQRRTYFVFPQLPGRYELPALSVQVVPAQPSQPAAEPVELSTPTVSFLARLPPALAAPADRPVVATPQLQVTTRLQGQNNTDLARPAPLQVGDTMTRTVTLRATDTLASALPALALGNIPGLSVYPDPPQLTNQFDRGNFVATRRDRITYVAEQPGRYQLPPQPVTWWNTRTQSLQTEVIPAVDLWVKSTPQQRLMRRLPWLAGLLAIAVGLVYWRRSLQAQWQAYRHRQQTSEPTQWRRLRQACREHDPRAIWIQLMAWLASTDSTQTVTLERFLADVDNPYLTHQVKALETTLFGREHSRAVSSDWSGQALYAALQPARLRWLHRQSSDPSQAIAALPHLNPTGGRNAPNCNRSVATP